MVGMDISSLGQLGVAGLAVFLFYKLGANHLNHNTKVLEELRDAIRELINVQHRR